MGLDLYVGRWLLIMVCCLRFMEVHPQHKEGFNDKFLKARQRLTNDYNSRFRGKKEISVEMNHLWTRPSIRQLEMVSTGNQTVLVSGPQVWGVRQGQWQEGARDLQPSHSHDDLTFVRSAEWRDKLFLLTCFKVNQCMIYTTWYGYDFSYRQDISDMGTPTPVDAKFFKQNDNLFLVVLFQHFRTYSETRIYRWHGTTFDLEPISGMTSTATSLETFSYGKNTLLVLGCRGNNKVKYPSQVWIREQSGQMNKVQKLPTVNPLSITHFVERGENFILVIEKNLNPVIYWWAGCEFVEWMRLGAMFRYYKVKVMQGQHHSYLIFSRDSLMKIYVMTSNNLEQIYKREFINWNMQKLYILNELMYKDNGKDYLLLHLKSQDEVLISLFNVEVNITYVHIDEEGEDNALMMNERMSQVSLSSGSLEDKLSELNRKLPTLLLTNREAELPTSTIRVPAAKVQGGDILKMTNTHLGIAGHIQHIISKVSHLQQQVKTYNDLLSKVQIDANRHLVFIGNVYLKNATFTNLHTTIVNGKEFKPETFLSTKDNARLKSLTVKMLKVDWLLVQMIGKKQVKDFIIEEATVKVPVQTSWLKAEQLNIKENSLINNITARDLMNKEVAVETTGENFNKIAQVGGVGRVSQPTTLQLLDHSVISNLYVDNINNISINELLSSLFTKDNNNIHGDLIFTNGLRVNRVINRSGQPPSLPGGLDQQHENTEETKTEEEQTNVNGPEAIPDRISPDETSPDKMNPQQLIPEGNISPSFDPNINIPVLYQNTPYQIIPGVSPVVHRPPIIYPYNSKVLHSFPQLNPYAQPPPQFVYGMPQYHPPPNLFYPRPQYPPQILPSIRYIYPGRRNKRDIKSRKNNEKIYRNKVTIRGNLKVDHLVFRNSSLQVSKHSVPLHSLDKIFWTNNTSQVVSNPIHFTNGITLLHNLDNPVINGKNLSSYSTKSNLRFNVVNVKHLNSSNINGKELKYLLNTKHLTDGGLRILTKNLRVDGDIHANQINDINVQAKLKTAVMVNGMSTIRQEITFKNVSVNELEVDIINGKSLDSWKSFEQPSIRVQGRIHLSGRLSVSVINSKPTNFSQVVNKSRDMTIHGRKHFIDHLTVTEHIKVTTVNTVNIEELVKNVLRNSSKQEVTGKFSLRMATIKSAIDVNAINSVDTSKFVNIKNAMVNLTGNIHFTSVKVEGNITTGELLNSCILPKWSSTSGGVKLVFTKKSELSSLTITGNCSWLVPGNGRLQHLFASAVTTKGEQTITGDVIFTHLFIKGAVISSLNDKNMSFIMQDTFSKTKLNQIISGKKKFRKIRCKNVLVRGKTQFSTVNKIEISDINQRIIRHNVEYGRTITGHKKFMSGFKAFMLKCPGGINNITARNLATEKYDGTLPPLIVSSLTVLKDLHVEEVNNLHVNKFLSDCIYLNETKSQFIKGELKIIGNVTLEGAVTFNSINNITHNQLVFTKTGNNLIRVEGCKTFTRDVYIEGDSRITVVNGNNLVNNYKRNIKKYENITIKGTMMLSEVELDTIFAEEYFVGNQQLFLNKTFVP